MALAPVAGDRRSRLYKAGAPIPAGNRARRLWSVLAGLFTLSGMKVKVRLFASLREEIGVKETEIELEDGATANSLWRKVV